MPIKGATILEGATCSATGGTARTYTLSGAKVNNGLQVVDTSVTDARIRPSITASSRMSSQDALGEWSFERRDMTAVRPKLLANGKVAFNSIRMIYGFHPESTAAELTELEGMASQMLTDADLANFRRVGGLD